MPLEDPRQILLDLTAAVGPATAYLARRLFESATRDACQRCLSLLSYARWLTPLRVERAALRLLDHDLKTLRFLIEQDLDTLVDRVDAEFDGQILLALPGVRRSH